MPIPKENLDTFRVLNSTWPKFRANLQNTGQSFSGILPRSFSNIEKISIGKIIREPVIGLNERIYVITENNKLVIVDLNGNIFKELEVPKHSTCPIFLPNGNFYISSLGKIRNYNFEGKLIWEQRIDGVPTSITINSKGNIFFAAHSFDWAGLYAYTAKGDRIFDISLMKNFNINSSGLGAHFSAPALTQDESIITAFRFFKTYTWDREEGPEPEHQYVCYCINSKGKHLWSFKSSQLYLWRSFCPIITHDDMILATFCKQLLTFNKGGQIPNWQVNSFSEITEDEFKILFEEFKSAGISSYDFVGYPTYNAKSKTFYCRIAAFQKVKNPEPNTYPPPIVIGSIYIIAGDILLKSRVKYRVPIKITTDIAMDREGTLCGGSINGIVILSPTCELLYSHDLSAKIKFCIIGPQKTVICSDESENLFILK